MSDNTSSTAIETDVELKEVPFLSAMEELETIVSELDSKDVDLDAITRRFTRAMALISELERRISKTRTELAELMPEPGE